MRSPDPYRVVRFILSGVLLTLVLLAIVDAQITVPFPTFTTGTLIQPSEVNANFAKFADALNRTGGTMTGTLTAQQITPSSTATYDLGLTGTRWRDGWFSRNVDIGGTLGVTGVLTAHDIATAANNTYDLGATGTRWRDGWFGRNVDIGGTLGVGSTGAAALDVAGGAQFGTGNVSLVGTDGRIPALNSTYFASATTATDWTFSGNVTRGAALFVTGVISPTAISSTTTNDWAPTGFSTAGVVRTTTSGAGTTKTINGLTGGASGRTVLICNANASGGDTLQFAEEAAGSTAANRFASTATVSYGACIFLWYDGTSSRWRIAS